MIGGRITRPLACLALALAASCGGPEPLLVIAGPDDMLSFELLTETGEVLWHLESDEPREVASLVYGAVPEGFRQLRPPPGVQPRELLPWEPLETRIVSETREFFHYGVAGSAGTLDISSWRSVPRLPSKDPGLAGGEAFEDEDQR